MNVRGSSHGLFNTLACLNGCGMPGHSSDITYFWNYEMSVHESGNNLLTGQKM
jgi:hypothetical protein